MVDVLEKAALPVWSDEQRRNLLHFVVVGGGPTGMNWIKILYHVYQLKILTIQMKTNKC